MAMSEIARRAKTLRLRVAAPIFAGGIVVGIIGYLILRELFLERIAVHVPYATAFLTMLPAMVVAWRMAVVIGRSLVRQRAPQWVEEIRTTYGVPREALEDIVRML